MNGEEIRSFIDQEYENIRIAKEQIKNLRKQCNHEKTHTGEYSCRIGASCSAEMCDYCDKVISTELEKIIRKK